MAVPAALVRELSDLLPAGAVVTDPASRATYDRDALTGHHRVPGVVVLPTATAEVVAVVRACARTATPFVARGAGTGLSGGALPHPDGVLLALNRMRAILDVDVPNALMTVQPGVTNRAISEAVAHHGLYYAPDPSSQVVCTIGGNVAENAGGVHCLKYGFTANHVTALEVVTAAGEVVHLGASAADPPGYDLRGVLIGSEGTLGIATAVTVRLLRRPAAVRTLIADFATPRAAGAAVAAITAAGIVPAGLEMMDHRSIQAAEADTHVGLNLDAGAVLLVELDGARADVDAEFDEVVQLLEPTAAAVRVAADAAERALLWRARKSAFGAMGRLSPDYLVQDGVVPRTRLADVLERIDAMADETGFAVANVFHAGDGNLHPLVLYDEHAGQREAAEDLSRRIAELCVAEGGSLTGEHGIGTDKACSMPAMFGEEDLAVQHRVKEALDPAGLANPDKIFPTPRLCGERPGPYRPHPLEVAGVAQRL